MGKIELFFYNRLISRTQKVMKKSEAEERTFPIAIRISGRDAFDKALSIVNAKRGFPNGFPIKNFPDGMSIEKASPDILKAQDRVRWVLNSALEGAVSFDVDGNPTIQFIIPKNWNVLVSKTEDL
jgi:hypothetical protein